MFIVFIVWFAERFLFPLSANGVSWTIKHFVVLFASASLALSTRGIGRYQGHRGDVVLFELVYCEVFELAMDCIVEGKLDRVITLFGLLALEGVYSLCCVCCDSMKHGGTLNDVAFLRCSVAFDWCSLGMHASFRAMEQYWFSLV